MFQWDCRPFEPRRAYVIQCRWVAGKEDHFVEAKIPMDRPEEQSMAELAYALRSMIQEVRKQCYKCFLKGAGMDARQAWQIADSARRAQHTAERKIEKLQEKAQKFARVLNELCSADDVDDEDVLGAAVYDVTRKAGW